jgi:hypothetical protein
MNPGEPEQFREKKNKVVGVTRSDFEIRTVINQNSAVLV